MNQETIAKTVLQYMFDFGAFEETGDFDLSNVVVYIEDDEAEYGVDSIKFESYQDMLDFVFDEQYTGTVVSNYSIATPMPMGQFIYDSVNGKTKVIPCYDLNSDGVTIVADAQYVRNVCQNLLNFCVALENNNKELEQPF
jgi:hypothetical protein